MESQCSNSDKKCAALVEESAFMCSLLPENEVPCYHSSLLRPIGLWSCSKSNWQDLDFCGGETYISLCSQHSSPEVAWMWGTERPMHTKHASRMPRHPYRCNTRILQPLYNVIVHWSSVSLYPIVVLDRFFVFRTVTHCLGATNILAQFFSSLVPKPLASIKRDSHLQRQ